MTDVARTSNERFYPGRTCKLIGHNKYVELERKLTSGPRALWVAKWVGIEVDSDQTHTEVRESELMPVSTVAEEMEAGIKS